VDFRSPQLDVPLKDARWEIFLPPDHAYSGFKGSMTLETTEVAAMAQDFTRAEYERQEVLNFETKKAEAASNLKSVRKKLAQGQVRDAMEEFNSARVMLGKDEANAQEVKALEGELNRVQGSNLIQAQRAYAVGNAARFGEQTGAVAVQAPAQQQAKEVDYETDVAQRQVEVLQKAQAVAVSRVQPLRVNLPTRGLRHAFTQVLQTEVNKPLTVSLYAASTRETGWFKLVLLWGGGFLALWIVAAFAASRRREA
jgi:hypothetical protein